MRFIPTYVGHTGVAEQQKPTLSVHPHIRGAYALAVIRFTVDAVHPHIRGAYVYNKGCLGQNIRFIPTYVGHTLDRRKKNGWFQPLLL